MVTPGTDQQVFDKLAVDVRRFFERSGLVMENQVLEFDKLFSEGMKRVKEYGILLGQYLAALTTHVETDVDTLMVTNSPYGSPIGVSTLPQILSKSIIGTTQEDLLERVLFITPPLKPT